MNKQDILKYYEGLSASQQKDLERQMQLFSKTNDFTEIMKMRGNVLDARGGECPHCDSAEYSKFGHHKTTRRYRCKACRRTFNEYTGTWWSGIRLKEKIPKFMKTLQLQLSLKKTSREVQISEQTAFTWRHRFLSALEKLQQTATFKGITEVDETYFLHSQKGKNASQAAQAARWR